MSKEREPASRATEVAGWATGGAAEERRDGRGRSSRRNASLQRFCDCCAGKTSKHFRPNSVWPPHRYPARGISSWRATQQT
jgi:hypothetical protein